MKDATEIELNHALEMLGRIGDSERRLKSDKEQAMRFLLTMEGLRIHEADGYIRRAGADEAVGKLTQFIQEKSAERFRKGGK